ncbi:hypothetical protein BGZ92_000840 [Podila epicladia]|nr:hypothetical protein BGZ92_000840 [Podila epicladia]
MSPPSNDKIQQRRAFLARYGNGSKAYFKKEGAVLMALITILIVGAGALALSGVSLSTYHYKLTQAHKTMALVHDSESNFHAIEQTFIDRSWNDASIYMPPAVPAPLVSALATPAQAVTRP